MSDSSKSFSQPNQSILAGVECLQWLATSERPIGSLEMAQLMGVDRNRANRILKSLVIAGMAEQTKSRKFVVGSGFHILAAQSLHASGILRVSVPILESLHELDCCVVLGVVWKRSVAYLYFHRPGHSPTSAIGNMFAYPALFSSIGRVLLAEQPESVVSNLYRDRSVDPFPDLQALHAELTKVRQQGFSLHSLKNQPSYTSVAIPLREDKKAIAAVALADFADPDNVEPYLARLRQAGTAIEKANDAAKKSRESLPAQRFAPPGWPDFDRL